MKIAIINDVHVGKPLERNQTMRAASHLAADALPQLLANITQQHSPDIIINLGDLIRSESREIDQSRYSQALSHFNQVKCPIIHLLGNHDIKQMSAQEVENIWNEKGFGQKSYGITEVKDWALIWLGMEYKPNNRFRHRLPDNQLAWLDETLKRVKRPVIIFTHCAVDDQEVSGNFFYEGYEAKDKSGFFLENYQKIQTVIANCSFVEMVVQAHLHYFHTKMIKQIPFVTCPAMGDNICAPNTSNHIPEIYTLLTVNDTKLVSKAFSREYCFAGAEFEREKK